MTNIFSAEQNAQALRRSPANKTHLSFWKKRIFQPVYTRDGQKITSPNFCVELQHQGKRVRWSLGPRNKEAAAGYAKQLFIYLVANGWPATLQKYRPSSAPIADPTVGELIKEITRTCDLSAKTLANYVSSLRKITSDIGGYSDTNGKFGHGKSHAVWIQKVDSIKLSQLNADAIQRWKISFINQAKDPVALRSRRVSCNSFLRGARSLFAPGIVKHLGGLELPAVLPFSSIEFESKVGSKYRSDIDVVELVRSATEELASARTELFKIFALALFGGLRRREIDLLPWSAFRWTEGVLRVEQTIHFSGKSPDSLADVPLDPEVMELFRGYQARATGEFVIESDQAPRQVNYNFYRAQKHFTELTTWLRSKGVRAEKPIHVLRKEYGSQLCRAHGIYAASRGLRHSSIAISAAFYTDSKAQKSVGLGHLLQSGKIVEFKQEVA